MTLAWAVRVNEDDAPSLAALRALAGVDIAEVDGAMWARGNSMSDDLDSALRALPTKGHYDILADGQLLPRGRRVPQGRLPRAEWQPLAQWIAVELPSSALPGELGRRAPSDGIRSVLRAAQPAESDGRVMLRIQRSDEERPATALVTELAQWAVYCDTAPEVRLKPLAFALSDDGRVLIRGVPLPPLAGQRYATDGVVAVPCGWALAPRLEAAVVRRWLQADEGDMLLLAPDGSYERIAADDFVLAGRGAARASAREAPNV